jgi:dTDP-4-dehydrorhamnose reductase
MPDIAPPKILVTGASGLLGARVCQELLCQGVQVIGLSQHQTLRESLATYRVRLDLCDKELLDSLLVQMRPSAVIHLAALADTKLCEEQPLLSRRMNVEVTRQIARYCFTAGIPLAFTSTDLVFDGTRGNYSEQDSVNPLNRYGEHKAEAENVIRATCPHALILRLPLLFGIGLYQPGPMQLWLEQLIRGMPLYGFADELRSCVDYQTAATGITQLLPIVRGETLHLGGIETLSRLILMRSVAEAFGLPPEAIESRLQADMTFRAARPRDVSLDSRKARLLGYKTAFLNDTLKRLAADIKEQACPTVGQAFVQQQG